VTGPVVAVVDDNPSVLKFLQRGLVEAGYAVAPFTDGEAMVAWLRDGGRPAVLVTDVIMPSLAGIELVAVVQAVCPNIRILVISGYPERQDEIGRHRFLQKPFRPNELAEAVHQLLSQSQAQESL